MLHYCFCYPILLVTVDDDDDDDDDGDGDDDFILQENSVSIFFINALEFQFQKSLDEAGGAFVNGDLEKKIPSIRASGTRRTTTLTVSSFPGCYSMIL